MSSCKFGKETKKSIVIGGGISGLTAGLRLSQKGFNVLVLEEEQALGGLASSYLIEGKYIPKTYHHVLTQDETTLAIIDELDLRKDLYWKRLKTGFFYSGDLYDFSSPWDILRFKPLPFFDRIRFGLLVLSARRKSNWMDLENLNVKNWICNKYSEGLYQNLIRHLVYGKFSESPENISAAWLMSRFGHESKSVTGLFGYIKNGGVQRLVQGLESSIKENKGQIKTGVEVKEIVIEDEEAIGVICGDDESFQEADAIITAIPIPIFLSITPRLPEHYVSKLRRIPYVASICVTLGLKKMVSKYYWLNIVGDFPFGMFEHKYLNPEPSPPGVMYINKYLHVNDELWKKDDEEIVKRLIEAAEEIFPKFKEKVIWTRLYKAQFSTPAYVIGYGSFMPDVRSPIKGLYIGGISRVFPKDRYMGTAMESGLEAAKAVIQDSK